MQLLSEGSGGKSEGNLAPGRKQKPRPATVVWVDGQKCIAIPLTKGQTAIVDTHDMKLIDHCRWHADLSHGNFYAKRDLPGGKKLRLHRLIYEYHNGPVPVGMVVDHINRNTLDNRRVNLRVATYSLNKANSCGKQNRKHNLPKGVNPNSSGFMARIFAEGHKIYLGTFRTIQEASDAYQKAWAQIYGA